MKHLIVFIAFFTSFLSFGQEQDTLKVEIGNGAVLKKYNHGKLESFAVEIYAMNYGNVLSFSKVNDTIFIKNAQESNAIIKVYIKNNKEARELIYKKKQLLYAGNIDFDLSKLPPSSLVVSQVVNNRVESYVSKSDLENLGSNDDRDFDKTFKLFGRLELCKKPTSIELIFNSFADFFSKEDALYIIYSSKYAEQYAKEVGIPLSTAFVQTNKLGEIKNGIIWTKKDEINGKYNIYSENKIIESGVKSLQEFQKIIKKYSESIYQ